MLEQFFYSQLSNKLDFRFSLRYARVTIREFLIIARAREIALSEIRCREVNRASNWLILISLEIASTLEQMPRNNACRGRVRARVYVCVSHAKKW